MMQVYDSNEEILTEAQMNEKSAAYHRLCAAAPHLLEAAKYLIKNGLIPGHEYDGLGNLREAIRLAEGK